LCNWCPFKWDFRNKKGKVVYEKSFLYIYVLMLVIPLTLFAYRGPVDFTLDVLAQYNGELGQIQEQTENEGYQAFTDPTNYQFGPEVRMKFSLIEISSAVLMSHDETTDYDCFFNGFITFGISSDISICRLGFGIGPDFYYETATKGFRFGPMNNIQKNKIIQRNNLDENAESLSNEDYVPWDMFITAPVNLRLTSDFLIGPLNLGLSAVLPTNVSLEMANCWKDLFSEEQDLQRIKIGVSMGFTVF